MTRWISTNAAPNSASSGQPLTKTAAYWRTTAAAARQLRAEDRARCLDGSRHQQHGGAVDVPGRARQIPGRRVRHDRTHARWPDHLGRPGSNIDDVDLGSGGGARHDQQVRAGR